MSDVATFGAVIAEARKKKKMSQKELAELIKGKEDGESISPQYLNDIEHDRRKPSSDHLVREFARVLLIEPDYLYYLAGRFPEDIRDAKLDSDSVKRQMAAFRKSASGKRKG